MFVESMFYTHTPKSGWQRLLKIMSKHAISRPSQPKTILKLFHYLIEHKQNRVRKTGILLAWMYFYLNPHYPSYGKYSSEALINLLKILLLKKAPPPPVCWRFIVAFQDMPWRRTGWLRWNATAHNKRTRTLLILLVTYPYYTITKEITILHHDLPKGFLQRLLSFSPDPAT